jgi:arylsulfatase A-like enzyme
MKLISLLTLLVVMTVRGADRPHVLWITSEDNGPQLGCYGDRDADTPNLNRLASRGVRFRRVWSVAPVCAPARTALISGVYPQSSGGLHMRSQVPVPDDWRFYPQFLREAGMYCTNNAKEDYNLEVRGKVWDESSKRAHWRNRGAGQAFFAVFNIELTHESQVRKRPHRVVHDPAAVRLPSYWPDLPEVRQDWAQYHDRMTAMDGRVGELLREVEEAGLAGETIVIYCGDHGPGLPRCKRTPMDSGLRVPLLMHFPEKWRHLAPAGYAEGGELTQLVDFTDFAPTFLSLYGLEIPGWMQGRAFAGQRRAEPRRYVFGMRDRMDERYDPVRSVSDGRWVYVRNFFTHRPAGQRVAYQFETPMTRAWHRLAREKPLPEAQAAFWKPHPAEELYDLENDPDEVKNLAGDPGSGEVLARMRSALREQEELVGDVSLLPEAEMLRLSAGGSPYAMARAGGSFRFAEVVRSAFEASRPGISAEEIGTLLRHSEAGVRWWGAMGCRMRSDLAEAERGRLGEMLAEENPGVRVAAAEALRGKDAAVAVLLKSADLLQSDYYDALRALNSLEDLGEERVGQLRGELMKLPVKSGLPLPRGGDYMERMLKHLGVRP